MSLLTEKQIDEICNTFLINRDTNIVAIKAAVEKWNEKQTSVQFEPNWDDIPEEVVEVQVKIDWLRPDTGDYYEEPFFIKIYERPLRAHPHAQIMMKYAEVAARRIDPWVEFEYVSRDQWNRLSDHPMWGHNTEYRHIGDRS